MDKQPWIASIRLACRRIKDNVKEEYSLEEVRALLKTKKLKKEREFSKSIVIFVIASNLVVLFASFYVTLKSNVEPSATAVAWFGFSTAEMWALAFIETNKIKKRSKEEEGEI